MNELAMNLATGRVHYGYLKVLIVGKAFIEKMLCQDAAMCNRVGIRLEFKTDPVSERNAVYHIKEKFLHSRQP
jgi:predicted phage-related endonuclease